MAIRTSWSSISRPVGAVALARRAVAADFSDGRRRARRSCARRVVGVAGIFCFVLARHIASPIDRLRSATKKIASQQLRDAHRSRRAQSRRRARGPRTRLQRHGRPHRDLVTAQRHLLSDVSHALRSPLARLNVALGLARRHSAPGAREHLDRIELETERLNTLIGQLLTMARVDSGVGLERRTRVRRRRIVDEVAMDADYEARARRCVVEVSGARNCMVVRRADMIRGAIENVVRNAVRTPRTARAVEISLERRDEKTPHGRHPRARPWPGVPEKIVPSLFVPFYRGPHADNNQNGTGLGLAITRRVFEVMEGRDRRQRRGGGFRRLARAAAAGAGRRRSIRGRRGRPPRSREMPLRRRELVLLTAIHRGAIVPGAPRRVQAARTRRIDNAVLVTVAPVVKKAMPLEIRVIGTAEAESTVAVHAQITGAITSVNFTRATTSQKDRCSSRWIGARSRRRCSRCRRTSRATSRRRRTPGRRPARIRRCAGRGLVSGQEVQAKSTAAAALDATVQADRAAVENAAVQLDYATIKAPIAGRTGALIVHPGNLVRANDATPLVVINRIAPINVSFGIPEGQLPAFKRYLAERTLRVEANAPSETIPSMGHITFIDNAVDPTTGTIKVKGSFANEDRRLWPGQFVNVIVTLKTEPAAVVVPTVAIQAGQQGDFAFVVKPDQTVDLRTVTVDRTAGTESVVKDGLKPARRSSPTASCGWWPAAASR
jgi:multidrug efflux system membrane fusion protein